MTILKNISYILQIRVVSRANYFKKKQLGTQNWKHPNRDAKNFQNYKIKMLKNKRNKPTYESADKSLFVQNFRLSFVAVSQAIVKQTH